MKKEIENNKICFIICSNNNMFLSECLIYLQRLIVPDGFEIEMLSIVDAESMAAGYNEGMQSSNAKYKVYIHQDTFIYNRNILNDIISIFSSNQKIGMIGMVGAVEIPKDGVLWHTIEVGNLYDEVTKDSDYLHYRYSLQDGIREVEAVDGFFIATAYDVSWRDDIFDGWHFYDVSQSMEFRKRGYKVVVPIQKEPWCLHDDGRILTLWEYNKYRKVLLKEYKYEIYKSQYAKKNL